jgi:hypothetical protein
MAVKTVISGPSRIDPWRKNGCPSVQLLIDIPTSPISMKRLETTRESVLLFSIDFLFSGANLMITRTLILLGAVALFVVVSAAEAQAARYRGYSHRSYRASHRVARTYVYPRVRQIDGRTLWDLGMQKGQWPSMP